MYDGPRIVSGHSSSIFQVPGATDLYELNVVGNHADVIEALKSLVVKAIGGVIQQLPITICGTRLIERLKLV